VRPLTAAAEAVVFRSDPAPRGVRQGGVGTTGRRAHRREPLVTARKRARAAEGSAAAQRRGLWRGLAVGFVVWGGAVLPARGQHRDILVQSSQGRLVTGVADLDGDDFLVGARVFTGVFSSLYAENDPGFNAIAAGSPALPDGTQALPGSADLGWDFLPMQIGGLKSALWHWDGVGTAPTDVEFNLPPSGYALTLFGKANAAASAIVTDALVPGAVIDRTAANGYVHVHRFFFLDDGDAADATSPADGVYLIAMRLRMAGLESSAPFFLAWAAPGTTLTALEQAARPWIAARVDVLATDRAAGDFNADGRVDGRDLLQWQREAGALGVAPGSGADVTLDGAVDAADRAAWEAAFGPKSAAAAVVPEPSGLALAAAGVAARRVRRGGRRRP